MNFDGVEEAQSGMTAPGTKGIFKITKVEAKTNMNGKEYLAITFESEDGSSFTHMFYWTEKAVSRIQHLWKHATGTKLEGEVAIQQVIAGLTGKKVGLKVIGRIGTNGRSYPDLSYGGFACDATAEEVAKLQFTATEQRAVDAALENAQNQGVENADSEAPTPEATATADDF